jgi:hypothetical protein
LFDVLNEAMGEKFAKPMLLPGALAGDPLIG